MVQGEGHAKPKYRQIADDLRAAILSGQYPPGSRLPTKDELAARYDAAVGTVDRAIEVLRREGLAETAHGAGTFVREPAPRHDPEHDAIMARVDGLAAELARLADRVDAIDPGDIADRPVPRPIVAAIVTSGQAVLITKRRDGNPPYGFVTGKIQPGESPADAGVREVKEETGLQVTAGREIGRRVHPVTSRMVIYMASRPAGGSTDVFCGDDGELEAVWWAGLDEALRLMPDMHEPVAQYLGRVLGDPPS